MFITFRKIIEYIGLDFVFVCLKITIKSAIFKQTHEVSIFFSSIQFKSAIEHFSYILRFRILIKIIFQCSQLFKNCPALKSLSLWHSYLKTFLEERALYVDLRGGYQISLPRSRLTGPQNAAISHGQPALLIPWSAWPS